MDRGAYSPWGHKESGMTMHTATQPYTYIQGNPSDQIALWLYLSWHPIVLLIVFQRLGSKEPSWT